MADKNRITFKNLAIEAGYDLDEALLLLWDAGLERIIDISYVLSGNELNLARRLLGLPSRQKLVSVEYWQEVLGLDRDAFTVLLSDLGFKLNRGSKTLPKGAIKKLKIVVRSRAYPSSTFNKEQRAIEAPLPESPPLKWSEIGHTRSEQLRMLTYEEVQRIHDALAHDFAQGEDPIQPAGVKSVNLLQSAVFRPHSALGESLKYPTIEMAAAALFHSLVHNHPFHNGNKRTALVSMLVFLDENNLVLTCGEDELFKFVLQVAQHRIVPAHFTELPDREVLAISQWIYENSRRIEIGERIIPFRKLRQILTGYGCKFVPVNRGSGMNITREVSKPSKLWGTQKRKFITHISYHGEGRDVEKETIRKVRSDLQLDDDHGVDSKDFYDNTTLAIADFITKYRRTLYRLAKL